MGCVYRVLIYRCVFRMSDMSVCVGVGGGNRLWAWPGMRKRFPGIMTQPEVTGGSYFLSGNDEINKLNMEEDASESLETCTFCLIANGADEEATILKKVS